MFFVWYFNNLFVFYPVVMIADLSNSVEHFIYYFLFMSNQLINIFIVENYLIYHLYYNFCYTKTALFFAVVQ